MNNLSQWLTARNLGNLEATLAENEVDLDVLFELTDDDLREVGLTLGARKRLRAAIDASASEGASDGKDIEQPPPSGAERRQLTTMFVDLVGSTALPSTTSCRTTVTDLASASAGDGQRTLH